MLKKYFSKNRLWGLALFTQFLSLNAAFSQTKAHLFKAAWQEKEHIWLSGQNTINDKTRHPNFMAIVSGIVDTSQYLGIRQLLE
jgi:hypothetical protein